MRQESPPASTVVPPSPASGARLTVGQLVGGRYEIRSVLGRGGMGEVWRARDGRLGRDVAIKVLPAEFAADPERLARFEREARATAALSHPNILAIFDVGIHDKQPCLVEELLEGESLRVRLVDGPLSVREALALGVQVARGLAAAHDKRIVHRDLKPDNVVVTPDGTAKILDFGLAKVVEPVSGDVATITQAPSAATGPGRVMGSAAYMAPEQARGVAVDHRADLFAFGVLLYELLSGQRPFRGQTVSDTVAAILKDEPVPLPEGVPAPVRALVRRCLEKRPEDRFGSAKDLAFALQAQLESAPGTAARPAGEERPYPGLAAFTEGDAPRYFGRDEEIAAIWRKLPGRSLLALIGPSGVGKTSFIRAGVVPHAPPGWRCIVAAPGQAPFAALARALAPSFSGDPEAFQQLLDFHDPATAAALVRRWRQRSDHGLVVVDQLEELFTLNAEEVQQRFAELLGALAALECVHVLLSMRDDFFFACHRFAPLGEVFLDVTPLGPPSPDGLRRALVEPARAFGFGFEDRSLVDEMVGAVEGERGALPLLAFAAASLWERRDEEKRLLTRTAYEAIGGVSGALAQHAEATLERLGADRVPAVRELFRNLVTSRQTRCVLDAEELLSVFPEAERPGARDALARLVDARLLTSYEEELPDGSRHERVEVVHESLLTAWPRLVRWRTEDESSSQLRDQLRQAAHLWAEKGRPEDLLWAGTSYREFAVWRGRYPGGLSEVEEAFARAMAELAGRRRRTRRLAVAAGFVVLLGVVAVIGTSLRRTRAALTRTDAGRLVALGRAVGVETDPTAALAYAVASLERADSTEARMLALDAMAHGPVAFIADNDMAVQPTFSHDGRWLVAGPSPAGADARVFARDGAVTRFPLCSEWFNPPIQIVPGLDAMLSICRGGQGYREITARLRSLPSGTLLGETKGLLPLWLEVLRDPLRFVVLQFHGRRAEIRSTPLDPAASPSTRAVELPADVGDWPTYTRQVAGEAVSGGCGVAIDEHGGWVAIPVGRELVVEPLADRGPGRLVIRHESAVMAAAAAPDGGVVATRETAGTIRLWALPGGEPLASYDADDTSESVEIIRDGRTILARGRMARTDSGPQPGSLLVWRRSAESPRPGREIPLPGGYWSHATDPAARWVGVATNTRSAELWDLTAPVGALPKALRYGADYQSGYVGFHPMGGWVAAGGLGLTLWPLRDRERHVLGGHTAGINAVAFAADGSALATLAKDASTDMRLWPLAGDPPPPPRRVLSARDGLSYLMDAGEAPDGSYWAVSSYGGLVLVPAATGVARKLEGFATPGIYGVAVSPDSSLVAGGGRWPQEAAIRVWEAATGREVAVLDTGDRDVSYTLAFLPDGTLLAGGRGVRLWDVRRRTFRTIWTPPATDKEAGIPVIRSSRRGSFVFVSTSGPAGKVYVGDAATGSVRCLESHGTATTWAAIDRLGTTVATGSLDGVVRVGSVSGAQPHLLLGHTNSVTAMAISPAGDWIASGSDDTTVRLWPMPDLSKPPAHTLPLPELLAKLKSQTNLRVVADPAEPGGYRTEPGPFPGWGTVPEWQP